ncbi:hypothetical protein [Streptomyces xylophagus]|uniref:hypothetical protein n=1 Tax=Streptomyces xylophagus TaxID=285514 RepID=UPI0005BAAB6C|nr:hypothetical protein [Streptomyces xylophagus]
MALDRTTSPGWRRLAKSPAALARDLLKTEGRLASGRSVPGPDLMDGIWEALRRLWDRVRGRSGAGGGGAAPDGGQEGGPRGRAPDAQGGDERTQGPPPEWQPMVPEEVQALLERQAGLEKRIEGLSDTERVAFEDELAKQLIKPENKQLFAELQKHPERMPVLRDCFNNAKFRESRRTDPDAAVRFDVEAEFVAAARARWERSAPRRGPSTREASFQDPSRDPNSDGNAFLAADHRETLRQGTESSAPPSPALSASSRGVEPVSPVSPTGREVIRNFSLPHGRLPPPGTAETSSRSGVSKSPVPSKNNEKARSTGRR